MQSAFAEPASIGPGGGSDNASMRTHRTAFTVATINDNFYTPRSNVPHVTADVLLAQEVKFENVDQLLGKKWGVHQDTRRLDKAGTAIAWNRDEFHHAKGTGKGYALAVRPNGHDLLNRWINYTDLDIDGRTVRMVSVHRPPKGDRALWPKFDAHLAAFVDQTRKTHKGPIIIGLDANQGNPQALADKVGLRWVAPGPKSLDGFLVSKGVDVEKIRRRPEGSSDHHPVVAKFSIHTPR